MRSIVLPSPTFSHSSYGSTLDRGQLAGRIRYVLVDGAKHDGGHRVIAHNRCELEHPLLTENLDYLGIELGTDLAVVEDRPAETDDQRVSFRQAIKRPIELDRVDGFLVYTGELGAGFV